MTQDNKWVRWSKQLFAIAQNGLTFTRDKFDRERYEQIQAIAGEMVAAYSNLEEAEVKLVFQDQGYATPKTDVRAGVNLKRW